MLNENVQIRDFREDDIPYKVKWINDPSINEFLHYDLPLKNDKTLEWFQRTKDRVDRYDLTIEYNKKRVGLIGLLNVDCEKLEAEYYITIGETVAQKKGIGFNASTLLLNYAFNELNLNRIYLFTETENHGMQSLALKLGFRHVARVEGDLIYEGHHVDRFLYELFLEEYRLKYDH